MRPSHCCAPATSEPPTATAPTAMRCCTPATASTTASRAMRPSVVVQGWRGCKVRRLRWQRDYNPTAAMLGYAALSPGTTASALPSACCVKVAAPAELCATGGVPCAANLTWANSAGRQGWRCGWPGLVCTAPARCSCSRCGGEVELAGAQEGSQVAHAAEARHSGVGQKGESAGGWGG